MTEFKVAMMPYEGAHWPTREGVPVPPGWVVDSDGRLRRLGGPKAAAGGWPAAVQDRRGSTPLGEDALAVAARCEQLLAEAKAAGWRPAPVPHALSGGLYDAGNNLVCGECQPCKNQSRAECIQKNSPVAQANAVRRARQREDWAVAAALTEAHQAPSGYARVVDVGDYADEQARKAEIKAWLDAL